jgi:glucokinase
VVGLGTGFNACPVFDTAAGRFVPPSEAGHVALPVSVPGLVAEILPGSATATASPPSRRCFRAGASARCTPRFTGSRPPPPTSSRHGGARCAGARDGPPLRAGHGPVIGDLALGHLPFAGISLVGGVTRAFAPWLDEFGFAAAFRDKGRFSEFMDQFGVQVVTDDYAALTGCASTCRGSDARAARLTQAESVQCRALAVAPPIYPRHAPPA